MWQVVGYPPNGGLLGVSSHSIVSYSYVCLMVGIRNVLLSAVGGMTIHPPNGSFWLVIYWQSVMFLYCRTNGEGF